ncbi:MAG: GntR family transcriptional regulator [Solirubrobacterales bacterium]
MAELVVDPIERSSLVDVVRRRLIGLIQAGELKPEDRIVESKLAQMLAVSRSPVREALRQLEQQGLVTSSVNRGYSVALLDATDYRELTAIRIALEKVAVGELTKAGLDARAEARLRGLVAKMQSAAAEPVDLPGLTSLDSEFHEELSRLSGNSKLLAIWTSMEGQITLALAANNRAFPGADHFAERHQKLVEAILSGDQRRAEAAIEEHIMTGLEEQDL